VKIFDFSNLILRIWLLIAFNMRSIWIEIWYISLVSMINILGMTSNLIILMVTSSIERLNEALSSFIRWTLLYFDCGWIFSGTHYWSVCYISILMCIIRLQIYWSMKVIFLLILCLSSCSADCLSSYITCV
jgi:hypothetical protein